MSEIPEQETLLKIVKTWRLSEKPEYRGFRCANCQEYKNEAWYHWVTTGGYRLPIHLCNDTCEPAFQTRTLTIDESKMSDVNRESFGSSYAYSPTAIEQFKKIVSSWPEYKKPELKTFTCDLCGQELHVDTDGIRKGYHVWWKMEDNTLAELHFHKDCALSLEITD